MKSQTIELSPDYMMQTNCTPQEDFDAERAPVALKDHLLNALKASNANPPDTDYQRGYLGALLALFEDLCMTGNERMQHRILVTGAKHCMARP